MVYDAVVIGGGIAGTSAAIDLARRGHRVLLAERQRYPMHKLCGEFLSVEVGNVFERLGVLDEIKEAGAHRITEVSITSPKGASFQSSLPGEALGISRRRLDHLLVERASSVGACVWEGATVQAVAGSLANGFVVDVDGRQVKSRLVIGAFGRSSALDRKLDRAHLAKTTPWVGFKAHFEGLRLPHRIELHAFAGGYCGLSHVEEGRVNVCWITHRDALKAAGGKPQDMIDHTFRTNPALAARCAVLRPAWDSFLAVSQISFKSRNPFEQDVCMIGDAAGMIAPLCGDGMAMALRSAELASAFSDGFLRSERREDAFRHAYTSAWKKEFGLRMRLGRYLHRAYTNAYAAQYGILLCSAFPALGRWFIRATRGV